MKDKKRFWPLLGIAILIFVVFGISYLTDLGHKSKKFLEDYINYINTDMEHRAELFESVIGGVCAGVVTFSALFITISHENRKDRIFWKREIEKDKENRLLSVRPFLNIEIESVSVARVGKIDNEKDFVLIGQGEQYQYACVVLTNHGYGKCKKIMLDGRDCSIGQLDIDEKQKLDIYFKGENDGVKEIPFEMFWSYQDIFGNQYLQQFKCCMLCDSKKLDIEIGEPLLSREER